MPVTTRRLAVAGVLTAAAVAVPAAALAGINPSSKAPSTPAHTTKSAATAKPKHPQGGGTITNAEVAARLASALGISKGAAEHALQQLQRNVTGSQLAAIAHELGVSPAQLNAALRQVKLSFASHGSSARPSGTHQKPAAGGPRDMTALPAAAALLSSRLGVSMSAAQDALHQLGVISARDGGVESTSPQFRAIAHQLGVSPTRLDNALRAVKEHFAGR